MKDLETMLRPFEPLVQQHVAEWAAAHGAKVAATEAAFARWPGRPLRDGGFVFLLLFQDRPFMATFWPNGRLVRGQWGLKIKPKTRWLRGGGRVKDPRC